MNLLSSIANAFTKKKNVTVRQVHQIEKAGIFETAKDSSLNSTFKSKARAFEAARNSRLNSGWDFTAVDTNIELASYLNILKFRARDLLKNSTLVNSYANLMVTNCVGSEGFTLKNMAQNIDAKGKPTGQPDAVANLIIENLWNKFSIDPCVSHDRSMKEVLREIVQSLSVDGEAVIILHPGFDNQFNYGIEVVDSLTLDPGLNIINKENGNKIICGIEFDQYKAPQFYYFRSPFTFSMQTNNYTKVPASRVLHLFNRKIVSQVRGFPPATPTMEDLKSLDGYIQAELTAARTSAAKMGFIEQDGNVTYSGDEFDEHGDPISTVEPGTIEILQKGQKFVGWASDHPNAGFKSFIQSLQMGISSSLGLSYNALLSDYMAVNYSSLRAAGLNDRETYKQVQDSVIEKIMYPMFEDWLQMQMLNKNVNLPMFKFDNFNQPVFHVKKGKYFDPLKEVTAQKIALEIATTSRTRIVAENGGDFMDILTEREAEETAMKEANVPTIYDLNQPLQNSPTQNSSAANAGGDETENN